MDILFSRWNPQWRVQFRAIQADLANGLTKNQVSYLKTEHVGSTSIAHLVAKLMIDILVVVADAHFSNGLREKLKEVLYASRRDTGAEDRGSGGEQHLPKELLGVEGYVEDRLGVVGGVWSGQAASSADGESTDHAVFYGEERYREEDLEKGGMD